MLIMCKKDDGIVMSNFTALHAAVFSLYIFTKDLPGRISAPVVSVRGLFILSGCRCAQRQLGSSSTRSPAQSYQSYHPVFYPYPCHGNLRSTSYSPHLKSHVVCGCFCRYKNNKIAKSTFTSAELLYSTIK